jgi:stress response protein SCP2
MSLLNKITSLAARLTGNQPQPAKQDNFPGSLEEMMGKRKDSPLRVSLNEKRFLCDEGGKVPETLRFGLGWTPAVKGAQIDLDASCSIVTYGDLVMQAWFRNRNLNGVRHLGDNLTGQGDDEDEKILVNFSSSFILASANLYLTVHSFSGHLFKDVRDVFCRVTDHGTGKVILEYPLAEVKGKGGIIVAHVNLTGNYPVFTAMSQIVPGKTVADAQCQQVLREHSRSIVNYR